MAVAELASQNLLARKPRSLFSDSLDRLRKNKLAVVSIGFIVLMILAAFTAPWVTMGDFARQDLLANNAIARWMIPLMPKGAEGYARVSEKFIFGADHLGRDLWTRTIYGARVSLSIAAVASAVSFTIGSIYGLISGYVGGKVDDLMMRFVDFLYGFPFLIVVILLQTFFKAVSRRGGSGGFADVMVGINNAMGGMFFLFIAIGMINWINMARVARGQVLSIRKKEYIEAARAIGTPDIKIIFSHILPNVLGPLIVVETMQMPGYIFTEAFLSFIGLGVDAPTPSWGIMIAEAAPGIRSYPNQLLPPALALTLTTLAFNFMGDGLRDAFDPRMKE